MRIEPWLIDEVSEKMKLNNTFKRWVNTLFYMALLFGWAVILIESYFEVTR